MKHKKKIVTLLLASALLTASLIGCNTVQKGGNDIDNTTPENITLESQKEQPKSETINIDGEYDPATFMRYALNSDGKSYSVCPAGLPDVIKELVIPGEYKGLPVTKVKGKFLAESSIETIIISEGIQEVLIGFDYCRDIKNIYIPSSVIYITDGAFNCRATMGGHGFIKSNVVEKIVVAEGNPYYYVDGNCLIEKGSQKIILGCNNSVIPNDGSVKRIGYAAFANCHSIETVILPKSIIELEYAAFDNCDNLKRVYITSSASKDQKIVNFDPEGVLGYGSEHIFYVPDADSLEIYSKVFGAYFNEIGTP